MLRKLPWSGRGLKGEEFGQQRVFLLCCSKREPASGGQVRDQTSHRIPKCEMLKKVTGRRRVHKGSSFIERCSRDSAKVELPPREGGTPTFGVGTEGGWIKALLKGDVRREGGVRPAREQGLQYEISKREGNLSPNGRGSGTCMAGMQTA